MAILPLMVRFHLIVIHEIFYLIRRCHNDYKTPLTGTSLSIFYDSFLIIIYACKAAKAMEYNFVFTLSPRLLNTAGTFAPATIAPCSPPANFVLAL